MNDLWFERASLSMIIFALAYMVILYNTLPVSLIGVVAGVLILANRAFDIINVGAK